MTSPSIPSTMTKILSIVIFFTVICASFCAFALPTVKVNNGSLEGSFQITRKGRVFSAFKAIPYALPPIGQLRFQPPRPARSWSGLRDAKDDSTVCIQEHVVSKGKDFKTQLFGSEDCLYLNVYTPKLFNESDPEIMYPVMMGIPSGSGNSAPYSPVFLLDKNTVLVTINYRLGPLGFLSTGDHVIRGNQGLKDQVQALRWIQENIAAFGGNRNSVTIFGHTTGALSTHLLMLSPLTKGLIHRVISQSGTARASWSLCTRQMAEDDAQRLGRALNCPVHDSTKFRNCLLKKDAVELSSIDANEIVSTTDLTIAVKPVIEVDLPGAFLNQHPEVIIRTGNLAHVPWMTSITTHEGAMLTAAIYGFDENLVKMYNDLFLVVAPKLSAFDHVCAEKLHIRLFRMIRKFYFGDKPIDESTRFNLTDMYTDAFFAVNAITAVREHLANVGSPIYFYLFAYRGTGSWSVGYGDAERNHGVCNGDDLLYLFPQTRHLYKNKPMSDDDKKMIDVLTTMWYNFAKTGNPTPQMTEELPVKWNPVRTNAVEYLSINGPRDMKMSKNLWKERLDFWDSLPCRGSFSVPIKMKNSRDEL